MQDERSLAAIARLERALSRIEAACSAPQEMGHDELAELRDRHHSLRQKVEDAVVQIDRLLASRGGQ
jgi:hypothetical protein